MGIEAFFGPLEANDTHVEAFKVYGRGSNLVLGSVGVGSNALILLVLWRRAELRTKSSLLMGALAFSDLVFCAVKIAHAAADFAAPAHAGTLCAVFFLPNAFFFLCSSMLICTMALDRFILMAWPLRYYDLPIRPYLAVWVTLALVYGLANGSLYPLYKTTRLEEYALCDPIYLHQPELHNILAGQNFVLIAVILAANFGAVRLGKTAGAQGSSAADERRRRFSHSVSIIVRVYLLSWATGVGFYVVVMGLDPTAGDIVPSPMNLLAVAVGYTAFTINACSNFFICFFRNEEYRKEFRLILGCKTADTVQHLHHEHHSHPHAQAWTV